MAKNIQFGTSSSSTTINYIKNCKDMAVSFEKSDTAANWLTITSSSTSTSGTVTLSVTENTTYQRQVYVNTFVNGSYCEGKRISVTQDGHQCGCDLEVTPNSLSFPSSASSSSDIGEITIHSAFCHSISSIDFVNGSEYFSFNTSGNKIYVVAIEANSSTSSSRYGALRLLYSSDSTECSSIDIQLIQAPRDCDCSSDFSITGTVPTFLPSESGVTKYIGYTADTCVTSVTASSNASWLTASANTQTKRIVVKCNSENDGSSRTAIVTVDWYGSNNCSSSTTLSVTQNPKICYNIEIPYAIGCEASTITANSVIRDCNGGCEHPYEITPSVPSETICGGQVTFSC